MANEENDARKNQTPNAPSSSRRFRLAEIFADANPTQNTAQSSTGNEAAKQRTLDERANALGVKLPPAVNADVIATANRVYDTTPRASVLRVEETPDESDFAGGLGSFLSRARRARSLAKTALQDDGENVATGISSFAPESLSPSHFESDELSNNTLSPNKTLTWNEDDMESTHEAFIPSMPNPRDSASRDGANSFDSNRDNRSRDHESRDIERREIERREIERRENNSGHHTEERTTSMGGNPTTDTALYTEIEQLRGGMEEMYRVMTEMQERGDAQDKVFNTLHAELQDYKNDFIYEHMKPVVRPLLFLFDHMEQFENELASQRNATASQVAERRLLSPELMCENISFFRDQLVEALRICEVTPMKRPEGEVDARLHKVVDTVPTDPAGHNIIQKVVRSGWYLNGRVFRPAEVVIGFSR